MKKIALLLVSVFIGLMGFSQAPTRELLITEFVKTGGLVYIEVYNNTSNNLLLSDFEMYARGFPLLTDSEAEGEVIPARDYRVIINGGPQFANNLDSVLKAFWPNYESSKAIRADKRILIFESENKFIIEKNVNGSNILVDSLGWVGKSELEAFTEGKLPSLISISASRKTLTGDSDNPSNWKAMCGTPGLPNDTAGLLNKRPAAQDLNHSTNQGSTLSINLGDAVSDPFNDSLTITIPPNQLLDGIIDFSNGTNFHYTPNREYEGQKVINYEVCDNRIPKLCESGSINITVNRPQVRFSQNVVRGCDFTFFKGIRYDSTQLVIDTLKFGASTGGDSIVYTAILLDTATTSTNIITQEDSAIVNGITHKTSQLILDTLVGANSKGCDSIIITDLTITIDGVVTNAPPNALAPTLLVNKNESLVFDLKDYASDKDGDPLTFSLLFPSEMNGGQTKDGSVITYTPFIDFVGIGTLNFKVCDSKGACKSSSITFNVVSKTLITVKGNVYEDTNSNNQFDLGEGIGGVRVINNQGFTAYTHNDGSYSIQGLERQENTITPGLLIKQICNGTRTATVKPKTENPSKVLKDSKTGVDFKMDVPQDVCKRVSGILFHDSNKNGVYDADEIPLAGTMLMINDKDLVSVNYKGEYSFDVVLGESFTLKPVSHNRNYHCTSRSNSYQVTLPNTGFYDETVTDNMILDFGIFTPGVDHSVRVVSVRTNMVNEPGKIRKAWMDYKVDGDLPDNCTLILNHDPLVEFQNASVQVSTKTASSIEWDVPSSALKGSRCMIMSFNLAKTAPPATKLEWNAEFSCPDDCPSNDSLKREFFVRGSKNNQKKAAELPNQISVFHGNDVKPIITQNDSVFSYTIDFQNVTGYDACHMAIIDTLSANIDISTLSSPFSSHPYRLFIKDGNILHFEFENINLPDSSNDEFNSYGFLQFNVKMKPGLPNGTNIKNNASIVFNYEYDKSTRLNSVNSKLGSPTGINSEKEIQFGVFPNPSAGVFNIKTDEKSYLVEVYNSLGKLLIVKENIQIINLTNYSAGVYNIRVNGSSKLVVKQ